MVATRAPNVLLNGAPQTIPVRPSIVQKVQSKRGADANAQRNAQIIFYSQTQHLSI